MLEVGNATVKCTAQQCTSCSRHLFSVEKGGRNSDSDYIEFSSDDDDHYDSDKDPSWCPGEGVSNQGGHGTGKTGNLVLTFSRQGKHREFSSDTGKNLLTQGKYLDWDY